MGAIKDLIDEGKVRYLGLSEANAAQLRRAHGVHPVAAREIEYSLATCFSETEILPTARELGIGIVPYSILYYGLQTGHMQFPLPGGDYKASFSRFQGKNLVHNQQKVTELQTFARQKGASPSQLALAWQLHQGDDIVPIVGMSKPKRVDKDLQALELALTPEDLRTLNELFTPGAIRGERYPQPLLAWVAS